MQTLTKYGYLDDYEILVHVGAGFHGEVVVATKDNIKYALKMYKDRPFDIENWKHEVEILQKLQHANIVKLIEFKENAKYKNQNGQIQERLVIVLEHVQGGELFYYLVVGRFSEGAARTYFKILLNVITYMHQNGIVHRDIKPQNILLDQNFDLKIIDFGFSTYVDRGILQTKCGTEAYMAPQIHCKKYEGKKADYFAAGIILFMLYSGVPPFQKANQLSDPYYKALYQKKYNKFWQGHTSRLPKDYLTNDFKNLIQRLLAHNPQDRITLKEINEHPWMSKQSLMLNEIHQQFCLRKKKIDEIRRMQLQFQRKKRQQMKKFQNQLFRSNSDINDLSSYENRFKIDYFKLQQSKDSSPLDLIINQTPEQFLALLNYYLDTKSVNLIFSETQTEQFKVSLDQESQQISVDAYGSSSQCLSSRSTKIFMQMFRMQDHKLKIRFRKDGSNDDLLAWKVVDIIKNAFYFSA